MNRFYPQNLMGCRHCSCNFLLIVCWCIGFIIGTFLAADAGPYFPLMRMCCDSHVSIVNLLIVPCFPFIISAIAVYYSIKPLLYLCAFLKMFCLGFCLRVVISSFYGVGLLVCILLLFTDFFTVPVLCRFQCRWIIKSRSRFFCSILVCLMWFAGVCTVDYLWIMPLLREII